MPMLGEPKKEGAPIMTHPLFCVTRGGIGKLYTKRQREEETKRGRDKERKRQRVKERKRQRVKETKSQKVPIQLSSNIICLSLNKH